MSLRILLDDQITRLLEENPDFSTANKNEFEIAVAAFASLKYLNGIEFDDLIDGIMGDGGDEGIDMCYIFCNGNIVKHDVPEITKDSTIKVKFFQVKKTDSFQTDGFRKLKEGIEEIFDFEIEPEKLQKIGANEEVVQTAELIRKVYRKAQLERAKFSCEVYYVTTAPDLNISAKIKHLEEELKENILNNIPIEFEYWGAQKLLDINKATEEQIEIKFESQPLNISEESVETTGYAGFVSGNDLLKALIDTDGNFKNHLTEGNVRYFLGEDKKINSSIINSAEDDIKAQNFWAMNNGLTIISDSVVLTSAKVINLTNPQIVNGCQTIHCLFAAYSKNGKNFLPNTLKVFVKIVKTNNLEVQTDIISATNSQNPVKSASLKANDNIQRNIEEHLRKANIFYERRENFYKRQGYKGNKVIGLLKMAQIIHTVVNKESVVAVNDTTTLFDNETKYNTIFSDKADFDLYKFATVLYQKIWTLKNSDIRVNDYPFEKRGLISKGGFVLLNVLSSLLFSRAEFTNKDTGENTTEILTGNIAIDAPLRKNEFTKRKKWLFEALEDESQMERYYQEAKDIFLEAALVFSKNRNDSQFALFKYRGFDKEFLKPKIEEYLKGHSDEEELKQPPNEIGLITTLFP